MKVNFIVPKEPPKVNEDFIKMLFGVSSEAEFIEKLARGEYGNIRRGDDDKTA